MAVTINPMLTTNAPGSFSAFSDGLISGIAYDEPGNRNELAGGFVATTETLPMWQGIGIQEKIPLNNNGVLGPALQRATAQANLTGFTVYNQSHAGLTSPSSPVPQYGANQTIGFFRFGSRQRITLPITAGLVSLEGGLITQQVSWDYTNQIIIAYDGTNALPIKIQQIDAVNSKIPSYNTGTGNLTYNNSGVVALVLL